MEYKKAINDTLNELKGSFRPANNDELVRAVKERADKMRKNSDSAMSFQTKAFEVKAAPQKSHKALKVLAGVAGTAAVLTGAFFGLKFLNEHGGLKGPDVVSETVVTGAGSHNGPAAGTTDDRDIIQSEDDLEEISVKTKIDELTKKIDERKLELESIEAERDSLVQKAEDKDNVLKALTEELEKLQTLDEAPETLQKITETEAQIRYSRDIKAKYDQDISDLEGLINSKKEEISVLENALLDAQMQLDRQRSEPDETEGDILQSVGDVLEFSDMTAKIHKYDYDGQFLRVMVEAEYHYPISEDEGIHRLNLNVKDFGKYDVGTFCLNDYKYVTAKYYQEIAEKIWEDPNVENLDEAADMDRFGRTLMYDIGIYIRLDPEQTAELQFEYLPATEGAEREYAGNYTLTGIDTTDEIYTVTDDAADTTVTVSKWGAFIETPYDLGATEDFSLAVRYKDSTVKLLADRAAKPRSEPTDDIPYYEFASYYTDLGRGRAYLMSSIFGEGKIAVENIAGVLINGREMGIDPNAERETSIMISFRYGHKAEFEFTYFIDGELQEDMTETRDMSEKQRLVWNVKGTGVRKYEIFVRKTDTDTSGKLLDMDIDFSFDPPKKTINDTTFDPTVFREIINEEAAETAAAEDETAPETDNGTRTGWYEGEAALEILKQYAGEDWCYPLGNTNYEKLNYRTHDSWYTNEHSGDYIFFVAVTVGEPIYAVTGGTVIEVNVDWLPSNEHPNYVNEGMYIVLQAPDGRKWRYSHLSDHYVNIGDTVTTGDRIAAGGATGWCTGPCLGISFPDSEVIDPARDSVKITE